MVDEEIKLSELLDNFDVKIDLPELLLNINFSSDFLKGELEKDNGKYIFRIDDIVMVINPKDKKETISKLVIIDDNVKGGVIYGYNDIQYLN